MPQRFLLVLVTSLAALALSGSAHANRTQFTTVEAPAELLNGAPDAGLDQVEALGAQAIRIQIPWRSVAPAPESRRAPRFDARDPDAYPPGIWQRFDAAIDGARARGLRVHVTLAGAAPDWATRRGDGLTSPNATAFGRFATAAGRRYGTRVSWWSVWNEPNLGKLLKPIRYNRSALVYRDLYMKAYAGLRGARVRAPILVGELAPIGNSLREKGTIRPLSFLRSMLCLDRDYRRTKRRCAKLPAQGFAMHPYSTAAGPFLVPPQDNVTIGVLPRLTRALDRAARAGAIARRLPIYITEFGVQSWPDKRIGVSLGVQSDYRSIAERIAFMNPRVRSFSQYLLTDDDSTGWEYGKFESGLYLFRGHRPKPAREGFRLPLVVVDRPGGSDRLWGLVRPARGHHGGVVTVEYRDRGEGWKQLGRSRFTSSGYWSRAITARDGRAFRVRWTAPDGTRHAGPPAYARSGPRQR
ncbi:MAG TPA: hypothetical protein VLK58_21430 [Conexibacter sp.]|nr:hypothetical protein [Conexibacter sp.]